MGLDKSGAFTSEASSPYKTYSGADIYASVNLNGKNYVFGELQTISYSIHREKKPVRAIGSSNPRGFVYGPRTIAGSLIFTVFDKHVMERFVKEDQKYKRLVTDSLPPFDITITFVNEYGIGSTLRLYGVTIVNEGQVMSVDDMMTENTMSYIATGIDLMTESGRTNGGSFDSNNEDKKIYWEGGGGSKT